MNDKNDTIVVPTENGNFIEPPPMRWTLRLIFIVVFIVGIIGNSVVCVAVIRRKRMRTSNNIFTFNLALCDLLNVVIYLPTQMAAFENDQNWAVGNFMCHFVYFLVPLCLCASIGTLLAITCDRYRAIAYPMRPRLSGKKVKIILAVIWISSLVICLPLIFVAGEVRPAPGIVYCDETWPDTIYFLIYWNFIFVIQYFLPLTMIAVLAVLIAVKIRQNNAIHLLPKSSQVMASAVRQRMKQTSKITNMLIALVILYAICMLPQHIVFLWWNYGDLGISKYRVYVLRFSNVFPMANSALNPIAYGTLNKEFKKVFKSFFNCECHKTDTDVYKGAPKAMNRSGKFRLAMYKRPSDASSIIDAEKRRKSSTPSLASLTTRKRLRRKEKNDYKETKPREAIPNGHATLSTTLNTTRSKSNGEATFNNNLEGNKVQNVNFAQNASRACLKSRVRSPVLNPLGKEDKLLIDSGNEDRFEHERNGYPSVSNELEKLRAQKDKKIADKTTPQHDTNVYGKKLNMNTLRSKENLKGELLSSDFQNDPFIDCWVEMNKIDKKILAYITALKETDI